MRFSRLVPIVTSIAVVVLSASGVIPRAGTAAADDETVSWGLPATSSLAVSPGDTVTWSWADDLPHTVTSLSGPLSFNSGQMTGSGQTFAVTFTEPGTYTYRCNVHPSNMTGTVVVQAAATPSPTATVSPTATSTPIASPTATASPVPTSTATETASPTATATVAPASPTATVATPAAPPTGSGRGGDGGSVNVWIAGVLAVLLGGALVYGGWRAWR